MSRSGNLPLRGLLILALAITAGTIAHVETTAGAPKEGAGIQRLPESPAPVQNESNPQVRELSEKLKALRNEFHSQLDPLQAQIKALKDKYDPQIQALEDQRKTAIEQAKLPAIQELDRQEDQELTALSDHEKDEAAKLKDRYAGQRKEIHQKYDQRRAEARGKK